MNKPSFTCQTPTCGKRRTYERVGVYIVVDACEGCGEPSYSLETVAT